MSAYPEQDTFIGKITIPDIDFKLDLYWSTSQQFVDQESTGVLFSFACVPGDKSGGSLILDHNYQEGKKLSEIQPGMKIYLDLSYHEWRKPPCFSYGDISHTLFLVKNRSCIR